MTEGVYELVTQLNRRLSEAREAISKQEVEITCLKNLVESAFLAGRRGQSWEDFKNENNLQ